MKSLRRSSLTALALAAGLSACGDCGRSTGSADAGSTAASVAPPPLAAPGKRPSTTSPEIALHNLNGEIRDRTEKTGVPPQMQAELVSLLLQRANFLGQVADLERADAVSARALGEPADGGAGDGGAGDGGAANADLLLARAHAHAALHRFDAALDMLERASAAGAQSARVARARGAIFIARGRYDDALTQQLPGVETRDSSLIATAGVLAAKMQKPAESERLFEVARARFLDVSPFTLAGMDFQRGQLFELAGDDAQAAKWFTEALDALPQYAHAAVHLAAGEAPQAAVRRLEAIQKTSDDPEVIAALAAAHERAGEADKAKPLVHEARARYDELLAKYPEAFADHAARFFLGPGDDPARALALAKQNAANRPTEEAHDLVMAAAVGAKSKEDVCAAARTITQLKYVSPRGKRTAEGALASCK